MRAALPLPSAVSLAAALLLAACGSLDSEGAREEAPIPSPVWAHAEAHLAVALAPEVLRGNASASRLLEEIARLLRPRFPELADGLRMAGNGGGDPALLVTSVGWRADGSSWTRTGPAPPSVEGRGSETLSASGPEPVAALVHLLPAGLPPGALAGLPDPLRRLVRSSRRVGLVLRAGEALSLSGRAEAAGVREAASLASILRGLAESSGAGAKARSDRGLADALAALRIESRGPFVTLEARLDREQARALLPSGEGSSGAP